MGSRSSKWLTMVSRNDDNVRTFPEGVVRESISSERACLFVLLCSFVICWANISFEVARACALAMTAVVNC